MQKLHVQTGIEWKPVFCHNGGKLITCENSPSKALPTMAAWGESDLLFFSNKFANCVFKLIKV